MTRLESVGETIDGMTDAIKKGITETETFSLSFLIEIAISLAVIADKMSEESDV